MTRLGRRSQIVAASGSGAVDSVNGETGVVTLDAVDIPFTPAGTIAATTTQAAIEEVAAEAGGGGITAAQAKTALSAGGSDPIENLGYVAFKTGGNTAVEIIDDPQSPGNPRLRILNATTGDAYFEAGLNYTGFPGVVVKDAGSTVASISETEITLGDPAGTNYFQVSADGGGIRLADPTNVRAQLAGDGQGLILAGAGGVGGDNRVIIKDDGTGITLYDANGDPVIEFPETGWVHAERHEAGGTDPIANLGAGTRLDGALLYAGRPFGRTAPFMGVWSAGGYTAGMCVDYTGFGLYQALEDTSSEPQADATWEALNNPIVLSGVEGDPNTGPIPTYTGSLYLDSNTGLVWRAVDSFGVWAQVSPPASYYSDGGGDPITALAPQLAPTAWNDGSFDRVVVALDGTGVTLNDALGANAGSYATALVLGAEGNNNHGAVIRGWDNAGKLRAQMDLGLISGDTFEVKINDAAETLRNDISCYDEAMEFNHQQDDAVLRAQVTVGASGPGVTEDAVFLGTYDAAALEKGRIKLDNSVLTMGIGSTGITVDAAEINFAATGVGFFGASAVGQSSAGTTAADAIACLQAFGFMAV